MQTNAPKKIHKRSQKLPRHRSDEWEDDKERLEGRLKKRIILPARGRWSELPHVRRGTQPQGKSETINLENATLFRTRKGEATDRGGLGKGQETATYCKLH